MASPVKVDLISEEDSSKLSIVREERQTNEEEVAFDCQKILSDESNIQQEGAKSLFDFPRASSSGISKCNDIILELTESNPSSRALIDVHNLQLFQGSSGAYDTGNGSVSSERNPLMVDNKIKGQLGIRNPVGQGRQGHLIFTQSSIANKRGSIQSNCKSETQAEEVEGAHIDQWVSDLSMTMKKEKSQLDISEDSMCTCINVVCGMKCRNLPRAN